MGTSDFSGPEWDRIAHHYGIQSYFPIHKIHARPLLRRYDYCLSSLRWARRWQAELVYTRLPQAGAFSAVMGTPTLLEVHDLPQGTAGPALFRLYSRSAGARRLVCITAALARDIRMGYGGHGVIERLVVAPDGVDLERYHDLPSPEQARTRIAGRLSGSSLRGLERFTAGYTGHLYPGRGIDLILELAANLADIDFLLVGGEPRDLISLQDRIAAKRLQNVRLVGFVPNAELPLFQAACDILLMPYQHMVEASSGGDISRYLSPMKLFEYMACARPVVSSDLPVIREVLTDQNSIMLPSGEVKSWAHTIQMLKLDPEKRKKLAAQARQDVLQYTWEKRAELVLAGLGTPGHPRHE